MSEVYPPLAAPKVTRDYDEENDFSRPGMPLRLRSGQAYAAALQTLRVDEPAERGEGGGGYTVTFRPSRAASFLARTSNVRKQSQRRARASETWRMS